MRMKTIYTILSIIFFRRNRYYKGQGKLKEKLNKNPQKNS